MTRYLILFILSLLGSQVLAQGGPGRMGNRSMGMHMDSLKVKLSLTDDQVKELNTIRENMRTKRRAIFEEAQGDRESMRAAMQELRAESDAEMKEILTLEQWSAYEVLRKEQRRRGEGREGKRPKRKGKKIDKSEN